MIEPNGSVWNQAWFKLINWSIVIHEFIPYDYMLVVANQPLTKWNWKDQTKVLNSNDGYRPLSDVCYKWWSDSSIYHRVDFVVNNPNSPLQFEYR